MSRGGVNTIIPGRLYQRANFLTWPYASKRAMLTRLEVDVVVNLWRPLDSDLADDGRGGERVYLNVHMRGDAPPPNAMALVRYLTDMLANGSRMLVHCEAGRNRSAWLCARLLMSAAGAAPLQAIGAVQECIPNAAINARLIADILDTPVVPQPIYVDG